MTDNKPRYSFGDVEGVMRESTSLSVGCDERNRISIEFNYTDNRDGVLYHVAASGWRSAVVPKGEEVTGEDLKNDHQA